MVREISLRRSAIGYVYRENPGLKREENLAFYDRVTASGVEISDFSIQGPELVLLRRAAPEKEGIEVRVGGVGDEPRLRLLIAHNPTRSTAESTREVAKLVWEAFQSTWGSRLSEPLITEVTLEFSVPAPGGDSKGYLQKEVAHLDIESLHRLGRGFEGFGLRLVSSPEVHFGEGPPPPLVGAEVNIRVETLFQDFSQLFLLVTSKWPAITLPAEGLPDEIREKVQMPVLQVNPKAEEPGFYLKKVYDFVQNNLLPFVGL
jgi:hypothetical protein